MDPTEFAHRLLVSLARQIRAGKVLDRDKLVKQIIADCIDKDDTDHDFWKERVEKRLAYLLEEDHGQDPLLVSLVEGACSHCEESGPCIEICPTGAITKNQQGSFLIREDLCVECTLCVDSCIAGSIVTRSEFAKVAGMILEEKQHPVYAILAPSFVGQFGDGVTPEILKGALISSGFTDVYEVAMASDIITRHEAEEFAHRMQKGEKFMITSCCCPAFIKLVEKLRPKVSHLVSPSVSPMIALGKMLKAREGHCRVVFIGPCIAKKAEAKRPDLNPAIDCVLTFKETKALLEASDVPLDGSLGCLELEDASHDGRIYARTGGVTLAITRAVKKIDPTLEVRAVYGDGLKECAKLLKELEAGDLDANFMEGMACPHGCIGGPGTIAHSKVVQPILEKHAQEAHVENALENSKANYWYEQYGDHSDIESTKKDIELITVGTS